MPDASRNEYTSWNFASSDDGAVFTPSAHTNAPNSRSAFPGNRGLQFRTASDIVHDDAPAPDSFRL